MNHFEKVYKIVSLIPPGCVATYGQVARWLGWVHGARTVGWALRALPAGSDVPWHRVVNAQGRTSLSDGGGLQQALLEAEGVKFDIKRRIDLKCYSWSGPQQTEDKILEGS